MSSVAYKLARGRLRNIEEVVDGPLDDEAPADPARDAAELVRETIGTAEEIKRLSGECAGGLRPDSHAGEIARAHLAGFLLTKLIELLPRVQDLVVEFRPPGYDTLTALGTDLVGIKAELVNKWLLPDPKKVERAKRELAEGKFRVL